MKDALIVQNIDDPSYVPERDEVVENCIFLQHGSSIGRFIFTKFSPMLEVRNGNCTIKNNVFRNGGYILC